LSKSRGLSGLGRLRPGRRDGGAQARTDRAPPAQRKKAPREAAEAKVRRSQRKPRPKKKAPPPPKPVKVQAPTKIKKLTEVDRARSNQKGNQRTRRDGRSKTG